MVCVPGSAGIVVVKQGTDRAMVFAAKEMRTQESILWLSGIVPGELGKSHWPHRSIYSNTQSSNGILIDVRGLRIRGRFSIRVDDFQFWLLRGYKTGADRKLVQLVERLLSYLTQCNRPFVDVQIHMSVDDFFV